MAHSTSLNLSLVAVVLAGVPLTAFAQTKSKVVGKPATSAAAINTVLTLSWQDCLNAALDKNADLKSAQATLEQNDALVKQARASFLPTVSATLQTSRIESENQTATSDSAKLGLSQNLFNGFSDKARSDQAKRNRDAAQANVDLLRAQVSAALKTTFENLLIAQKSLQLADDIVTRRKRNSDLVSLRYDSGRENKGSVLLSNANFDQSKLERLQAANTIEAARLRLAKQIGREDLGSFQLVGEVPLNSPPLAVDFTAIASDTPEVRRAISTELAAQANVKVSRENFFPSLDLSASVGRSGNSWFPSGDDKSIGLTLSIPLFEGGRDYYGVQAARAAVDVSQRARENVLRDKLISLRETYNTYIEAVEKEKVTQSFLKAARTRADIARSQYNTGLISFQDWDLIENDLVSREKAALSSQSDRVAAEAAWEQSQGRGVLP